jgi:hypothetical protein
MRFNFPLLVALLGLFASGAAIATGSSSSGGGGSSSSSGGGGGGHGGGGGNGHGGGAGHGAIGSTLRGGIGIESLGRGSFAQALGGHGAAAAVAKKADAVRTASKPTTDKPKYPHRPFRWAGAREQMAYYGFCAAPSFDRYDLTDAQYPCGRARKAPIDQRTGQPIG